MSNNVFPIIFHPNHFQVSQQAIKDYFQLKSNKTVLKSIHCANIFSDASDDISLIITLIIHVGRN